MASDGIQHHVLWKMDGRTWIEVMPETRTAVAMSAFGHAVEKGWATIIPASLVLDFVQRIEAYDELIAWAEEIKEFDHMVYNPESMEEEY